MPILALADTQLESSSTEPETKTAEGRIGAEVPITITHFERQPHGFQKSAFEPPLMINAAIRSLLNPGPGTQFYFHSHATLGFTRPVTAPLVLIAAGFGFQQSRLEAEGDLEFGDQRMPSSGPLRDSQFSTRWLGLGGALRYRWDSVTLGMNGRLFGGATDSLSLDETLETLIKRTPSYLLGPSLTVGLPLGLWAGAGVDFFILGPTAIASKEFVFSIPSHTLTRYSVSAGARLGELEVKSRVAFLDAVSDLEEHFFQAPYLIGDYYLLSPKVVSVEVLWHF